MTTRKDLEGVVTTRKDLENEREALRRVREYTDLVTEDEAAALTASIARVEALLTLTDEDCRYMSDELLPTAPPAWHVVASLVRRTP